MKEFEAIKTINGWTISSRLGQSLVVSRSKNYYKTRRQAQRRADYLNRNMERLRWIF